MACAVPMGHSLQFLGIEIGSKREYNLFKDTQHLSTLCLMEAGKPSKMSGCVEYHVSLLVCTATFTFLDQSISGLYYKDSLLSLAAS